MVWSCDGCLGFPFAAVSKLMGSQGCGGTGPKVDSSRSFSDKREAAARSKIVNGELFNRANQLPCPRVDGASKDLYNGGARSSVSLFVEPDAKQQRKGGKMPRCNGGSSKRSRTHVEVSIDETEADMKGKAKEGGLSLPKCNDAEKLQTLKKKTILNSKRVDKRYAKAFKGKYDSFSVKSGLASFSAAAGGNSTLGFYGLRPDLEDFTKHVEDLSLTELLDGSYNCPSFSNKDKGKKYANSNSNILHSVGEVWAVLQTRKVKPQIVEIDGACNCDNTPSCVITSASVASKNDGDKRDTNMPDANRNNTPCEKDSNSKLENAANIHDSQLHNPTDILERLALPPPKDLELLLQDAVKPNVASKNYSDLRLGKPAYRCCLQPFSWSNASLSHCKSYSDSVKLSTSRSTCHGRWVKMEMPVNLEQNSFLSELKSLKYDDSLVPSDIRSVVPAINEKEFRKSVSISEQGLPSSGKHAADSLLSPDSPRTLAAAQILSAINARSSKKTADGAIKSPKRPPQKSMRAHSSFSLNEKSENTFAIPESKPKSDSRINMTNETRPLKKLKPPLNDKVADFVHSATTITTTKGPLQWSMPRSSRSCHNKSFRYPVTETKHYNTNIVKKSFMMPPASRTFHEASSTSQQKPRKVMRLVWNRESGKLE